MTSLPQRGYPSTTARLSEHHSKNVIAIYNLRIGEVIQNVTF
jgi:hypothetical protein